MGRLAWSEARKCKFIPCPIDGEKFFNMKASGDPSYYVKNIESPDANWTKISNDCISPNG